MGSEIERWRMREFVVFPSSSITVVFLLLLLLQSCRLPPPLPPPSSSSSSFSSLLALLLLPTNPAPSPLSPTTITPFSRSHKIYHGLNLIRWLFVLNRGSDTPTSLFNLITGASFTLPPLPRPTTWTKCSSADYHINCDDDDDKTPNFLGPEFCMPSISYVVVSAAAATSPVDWEVMVIHGGRTGGWRG